ncbi:MAG TPA: AMP-binding protein [Pyrinomonadaceae bacterium]|nr:AMP-binding protein [Pyrinomonadaceae bacterium]
MPIPNQSFCQRVVEAAGIRPDKVAMMVIDGQGCETTTFGSMLAQIRSIAYRLTQERIAFGDRVAIMGENHPNWAIAYLGILYRGAVVTPLDPAATTQALASFLGNSEAKLAFVSPASLTKFRAACEQLGRNIPAIALRPQIQSDELAKFEDWANSSIPAEFINAPPPAKSNDLAVLIYTSGTTGVPKAVPLTHGNIYAESDKVQQVMHVSDQEVLLSLLPLFHAYSQIVNLWLATIIGGTVVYLADLSSAQVERGLKASRATALIGVPRLWYLFHKKIFDQVNARSLPLRLLFKTLLVLNGLLREFFGVNGGRLFFRQVHESFGGRLRLAVSAGASFDASVAQDFHRLGFTILQGYGLTETSGAATVTRFEDNKVGSVGKPLNGVEVKINEPNAEGVGEILIRGPIVMSGYYQNPVATREAFTGDGWFRSGDLGHFDSEGHLYVVGRKKDVIKLPSGKNVFPEDVEAHYEQSPFVSEVCVLGLRDEASEFKGAEKLCAVVVPDFDYLKTRNIANAREWVVWELENLGRELPEYQRVHDFVLRAEPLPRTSTRKVRRFELKDQIESERKLSGRPVVVKEAVLTATEQSLMDSPAGQAVISAIKQQKPDIGPLRPGLNLEIDLGLDSLARAECVVSATAMLEIELKPEELARVQTVGELVQLADAKLAGRPEQVVRGFTEFHWREILKVEDVRFPELESIIKKKPAVELFAFVVLRVIYLGARLFFRFEVKGAEALVRLQPPYLICPNHQSYLDPFLVCSVYSRAVLRNTFHVGASMFFTNPIMKQLARLINVIPIDPDLQLQRAMRASVAGLRMGKILNIYPEGQRSFDGQLLEFKKGAAILASELNVPIVPVAIDGAYLVWPRKSWRLHFAKVKLCFGDPIDPAEVMAGESNKEVGYKKLSTLLSDRVQKMLDELRS